MLESPFADDANEVGSSQFASLSEMEEEALLGRLDSESIRCRFVREELMSVPLESMMVTSRLAAGPSCPWWKDSTLLNRVDDVRRMSGLAAATTTSLPSSGLAGNCTRSHNMSACTSISYSCKI